MFLKKKQEEEKLFEQEVAARHQLKDVNKQHELRHLHARNRHSMSQDCLSALQFFLMCLCYHTATVVASTAVRHPDLESETPYLEQPHKP